MPAAITPIATRAEGLARLEAFLPYAGRAYSERRNHDTAPDERANVSKLSPYLRPRLITEREVVAAVLDRHGPRTADKFVQEVLWRTYWKGWLKMRPGVWTRFQAERDVAQHGLSDGMTRRIAQAEAGTTGIEGFDNWARELTATGYLHNHARMWFASIWIFTLGLPWTLGADFFLRHLLDADPASNTLSWRWVAGLQTVGKTYLADAEIIERCTGGRFRPQGLAVTAEPLIEPPIQAARPPPVAADRTPSGRSLLLVTPEDLNPETVIPSGPDIVAAVVCSETERPTTWPWGDKAHSFVREAAEDAAQRISATYAIDAVALPFSATDIAAAAHDAGARTVVTPYAPVGPVADALTVLADDLATHDIALTRIRRSWDSQLWPLATKGFFPFKERAPAILAADGLPM